MYHIQATNCLYLSFKGGAEGPGALAIGMLNYFLVFVGKKRFFSPRNFMILTGIACLPIIMEIV